MPIWEVVAPTVMVWVTGVAAAYWVVPAWVAVTVQVPDPVTVTVSVLPVTVQWPVAV